MEQCKVKNMYDLNETIAAELLEGIEYPWEALKGISNFIKQMEPSLNPDIYEKKGEDIWVAKSAKVAPTAFLSGEAQLSVRAALSAIPQN